MIAATNVAADPRFARLEALIEAAHTRVYFELHCHADRSEHALAQAQAVEAENALDAYVAEIAAVRPQTFAEIALQARASAYRFERYRDFIADGTEVEQALVASILDAAGIVPISYNDQAVYARAGILQDDDTACLDYWRRKVGTLTIAA